MALLPNKNVMDGSKTPAPTVAEIKTAWGTLRDFMADLLGTDSSNKKAARAALGVPSVVDVQAGVDKFAAAAGTGDAMTVTMTPPVEELVDGMEIRVRCKGPNTVIAPTLKLDELPEVSIVAADGSALVTGAYLDKWPGTFRYRASTNKFELLDSVPVVSTGKSSVRQTVLSGAVDANGYANMLSAGTGLSLDLSATTTPLLLSFANGFDAGGENNLLTRLTANVAGVVFGLAASNVTYVYADYVSPTAVTWGKTLAPPQDGYTFDRRRQTILQFGGVANSNAIIDDFGNNWLAMGGAKIQTAEKKFGTGALGGSGAANALNGTSDYIRSTDITSLGNGGWSMRGWFKISANTANNPNLFGVENAAGYGCYVRLDGSLKFNTYISSTGTSWDILGSPVAGATALVVGTWAYIEHTFDPVAGKYFLYLNGVADAGQTATSSARVCGVTAMSIGADTSGPSHFMSGYVDKFEFLPYCDHPNGTTYAVPVSPPDIAAAGYASNFFSIPEMKMYQITGPSVAAGTNPTMTAKSRLYVGQVSTGSAGISSVINYAIRGRYYSGRIPGVANASYTKNHYSGSDQVAVVLRGAATPSGPLAQLEMSIPSGSTYGGWFDGLDRNVIRLNSGNSGFRVASGPNGIVTAVEWDLTTIRNY